MRTCVGVVSRFDACSPKIRPFNEAFARVGLEFVPFRLGEFESIVSTENGLILRMSDNVCESIICATLIDVDAILWRVSENHYLKCRGLMRSLNRYCRIINSLECVDR